jgi:hypothetical protein
MLFWSHALIGFRADVRYNIFADKFFMSWIFENSHWNGPVNLAANKYIPFFPKLNPGVPY